MSKSATGVMRLNDLSALVKNVLELHVERGVVLLLEADREIHERVKSLIIGTFKACDRKLQSIVFNSDEVLILEQLKSANSRRDFNFRQNVSVLLLASSPSEFREIRKVANDLTTAPEMTIRVESEPMSVPWSRVVEAIRTMEVRKHKMLDLTGLIPASAELRELDLEEVYMDLLELPPSQNKRWLLLANPGAGKTTALRHLALQYSRDGTRDVLGVGEGLAPIFISLGEYGLAREARAQTLAEYISDSLKEQSIEGAHLFREHLSKVILLIDGLDELREQATRRAVLDEVGRMGRGEGPAAIVVSGRTLVVDDLRQQDAIRFTFASCRPPKREEIVRFLAKFLHLRRRHEDSTAEARSLAARILSDPQLSALARTPLLLVFLALLHDLELGLPERRIDLYWRLGELLVERWTRARILAPRVGPVVRSSRADALRVLGPLAWWSVALGGGPMLQDSLLRELSAIEAERMGVDGAAIRASQMLELLKRDTALLVRQGDRWAFVHLSVAEYFAAVEACRDGIRWRSLLSDPFRSDWREIIVFSAGFLGVIEARDHQLKDLVDAVLRKGSRQGRYDARYPLLLMALVDERPGMNAQDEREMCRRIMRFLFRVCFAGWSAGSVQSSGASFLERARGQSYEKSVHDALVHWMNPVRRNGEESVRLEHMLLAAPDLAHSFERLRSLRVARRTVPRSNIYCRMAAEIIGGRLLGSLPWILGDYEIDTSSYVGLLQQHKDPRATLVAYLHALGEGDHAVVSAMSKKLAGKADLTDLGEFVHSGSVVES